MHILYRNEVDMHVFSVTMTDKTDNIHTDRIKPKTRLTLNLTNYMRLKNILISAGAAVAAGFAAYATMGVPGFIPQQSPQRAGEADADETVTFYGAIESSDSWGQSRKVGIYSFDNSSDPSCKEEGMIRDVRLVTGGGAYAEGMFYYINGVETAYKDKIQNTFNTIDTETWQSVNMSGHTAPTLTDAYCMAYDYTTSTMYAFSRTFDESGAADRRYALRKVNLESGEFTHVAYIDGDHFVPAMAFDQNGQLYGMERLDNERNARLLKIDKQTGATQVVGTDMGFISGSDYAGAVIDYRDGSMYVASVSFIVNPDMSRTYSSHLYKVDVNTGSATSIKRFEGNEVLSCLFIKDSHPQAPAGVTDLGFSYNNDTRGRVTFTIPTECYNRTPLTGTVKAEIYVNGTLSQTIEGKNAGDAVQSNIIRLEEDRMNPVKVYCYDSEGRRSVAAYTDVWGGKDVPAAPGDINVTTPSDGASATITWTAPTVTANGGRCDLENITYKVVRRPEMVTVAQGLTDTQFTDVVDRKMGVTQYEVRAESANGEGNPAYSQTMPIGQPHPIRYRESFDDAMAFLSYTTISVNGVASPQGNAWMYYPQNRSAIYWLDYDVAASADAWLITPTLALEQDKVYRLDFDSQGFASETTYQTLTASVGDAATQEGMKREFFRMEGEVAKTPTSYHGFFVADQGDNRVGLHLQNAGRDHCQIDNIIVSEYGPSTIPAAPEIVTTATVDRKSVITVKAPTSDTRGRDISSLTAVTLYRIGSTRAVKVIENPVPGENVVLEDEEAVFGLNHYYVTATNADGQGLETNVDVNTRAAIPVPVENVTARTVNSSRDVELSWSYPEGYPAADGSVLDPEEISYDIYRADGVGRVPVAQDVRDTKYTHTSVMELFPGAKQARVTYYIVPVTSGGQAAEKGVAVSVGDAYDLPIAESNFYEMQTSPWISTPVTAWQPGESGYIGNTRIAPYVGYTMMRTGSDGTWLSPRINLTSRHNPVMTFMLYCGPQADGCRVEVGVVREIDGVEADVEMLPQTYQCSADEYGWQMMTVDLSAFADCDRASLVFRAFHYGDFPVLVDDIRIDGTKLAYDPRVASLEGPSNCVRGRENIYVANLRNNGINDMTDVKVTFYAGETEVSSQTVDIAGEATVPVEFTYEPELNGADNETLEIKAVLEAEADGETFASEVARLVKLVVPNVPYVTDLVGAYDFRTSSVKLTWSEAKQYPRAFPVKDDFESYADWAIDNIGDWKLVDADGGTTIGGIQNSQTGVTYSWPNVGLPQAYIVFNPGKAYVTELCKAYSGEKCLVAFTSSASSNDDWLISPQLLGAEQTISFQARVLNPYYDSEKYEVLYSTSGNDPEDFVLLKKVTVRSSEWSRMEYTLPDGARYFAIRCTSAGQFGLMLDDIEYIPAQPTVMLYGYKLYRNGEVLKDEIGETAYSDSDVHDGETHEYRVSAAYDDGESILSEPVSVEIKPDGIAGVNGDGVSVTARESRIVVDGAASMSVAVCDVEGRLLFRIVSTGHDVFDVCGGVYIVTVGNKSYKLLVK